MKIIIEESNKIMRHHDHKINGWLLRKLRLHTLEKPSWLGLFLHLEILKDLLKF